MIGKFRHDSYFAFDGILTSFPAVCWVAVKCLLFVIVVCISCECSWTTSDDLHEWAWIHDTNKRTDQKNTLCLAAISSGDIAVTREFSARIVSASRTSARRLFLCSRSKRCFLEKVLASSIDEFMQWGVNSKIVSKSWSFWSTENHGMHQSHSRYAFSMVHRVLATRRSVQMSSYFAPAFVVLVSLRLKLFCALSSASTTARFLLRFWQAKERVSE